MDGQILPARPQGPAGHLDHFGQNPRGELLGLVMNVGDVTKKTTRVYETNLYLPYHSDPSDVVGLLCVRKAKQGGLSSLVSVAAIHNEILASCPQYP